MKKRILPIILAIVIIAAVGSGVYVHFHNKTNESSTTTTSSETAAEQKVLTLEIIADGEDKTFQLETTSSTLGGALVETGYVKNDQAEYGLYIQTVYGLDIGERTCDPNKQEWWCVTKNGETVMTGADSTPIKDGEHYELTLKTGY